MLTLLIAAQHHALHDDLTDLFGREEMLRRLDEAVTKCRRSQDQRLTLLFTDLDFLKRINDTFGHACGDRAVRAYRSLPT